MKIRTRLTLQFSLIVAFIIFIFSVAIYILSSNYRQQEFYDRLNDKAINSARILIEVKEVDQYLLKIIDKRSRLLPQEKILIYSSGNKQIYNSADDDTTFVPTDILAKIRNKKNVEYKDGEKEVVGILYTEKSQSFVIIASAYDKFGLRKLRFLSIVLAIGFITSVALTTLVGWFYAGQALKPISNVINEVSNITVTNLHSRVNEGNGTDEIALLAITFNKMLDRLITAFEMQRSFMSNASHELRTPLTTITGQIDVTLMKPRDKEEYEKTLHSVLDDIKNLNKLSNGLLDLAQANSDISRIVFKQIRIDELLWQTREELMKLHNDYMINIHFEILPDDEKELEVTGNEQLLKIAVLNLMENACKFSSDKQVSVFLKINNDNTELDFNDNGIGIPPQELSQIFEPFYRGSNAINISGHGLGLALTKKIIELHNGFVNISSTIESGTIVKITLLRMN